MEPPATVSRTQLKNVTKKQACGEVTKILWVVIWMHFNAEGDSKVVTTALQQRKIPYYTYDLEREKHPGE